MTRKLNTKHSKRKSNATCDLVEITETVKKLTKNKYLHYFSALDLTRPRQSCTGSWY